MVYISIRVMGHIQTDNATFVLSAGTVVLTRHPSESDIRVMRTSLITITWHVANTDLAVI
jgi:hypothetical protein